ncbi:lipoprotein N-acyltransferase Lnb domain-containing protein [Pseudoroseomonas ludipueritiae]
MRWLFLSYLDRATALEERPMFYNTLTSNCRSFGYPRRGRRAHRRNGCNRKLISSARGHRLGPRSMHRNSASAKGKTTALRRVPHPDGIQ